MPNQASKVISEVKVGDTVVQVEIADTDAERERGLSYRDVLLPGHGMLFIFNTPGRYGFWMKDTYISLDMLFADKDGKIVTIHHNVSPDSYAKNPPEEFYPASDALYVLEVPGGYAAEQGIAEGMSFVLQ